MAQNDKKADVSARAVDVDPDTTPTLLGPGDPVEVAPLSQMGATFAERAKAREKALSRSENKSVGSAESKRK